MKAVEHIVTASGCWECISHSRSKLGYVRYRNNGKEVYLHHYVYEVLHGPVPKGMRLRHTCGNHACVNPEHLELVRHGGKRKEIEYRVDERGCHNCVSHSFRSNGYPRCKRDGRMVRLSRVVYAEHFGEIPDGMLVLHTCDNPLCVNPEHLKLGTHLDNMRDMKERGRSTKGRKKTRRFVREIIHDTKHSISALAKKKPSRKKTPDPEN